MAYNDDLERKYQRLIADLLLSAPDNWTEYDPDALSHLQDQAFSGLYCAGMIERREKFRINMFGYSESALVTTVATGERGFIQAIGPVLEELQKRGISQCGQQPIVGKDGKITFHLPRISNPQWRLTSTGVQARSDLQNGHSSWVFEFVFRCGFFDGRPRLMPDGKVSQRLRVDGNGRLEQLEWVPAEWVPAKADLSGVKITNWEEGAEAIAAAVYVPMKSHELHPPPPTVPPPAVVSENNPSLALLRVFTNGIADDRFKKAAQLLGDNKLTVNEKLTKIDALISFPSTSSAEELGEMLGVTKQAVLKTDWWIQNRKGEKESEVGRRREGHRKRAKSYEAPGQDDDE